MGRTWFNATTWARWAKRVAPALALVVLLTEEIVKYLWHHPEVEHVEVVLPALPLPPTAADEPPPGQQMLVVPRWYEEQRRQAVVAATSLLYRNHALYAATAAPE